MEKLTSKAWKYFKKNKDTSYAQCLICPKQLSCKGSSTSGLARHLENIHKIYLKYNEPEASTSFQPESKILKLSGKQQTLIENADLGEIDLKYNQPEDSTSIQPESKKKKKSDKQQSLQLILKKLLGEIVSRLAAKDGISIRAIIRSEFIHESLMQKGYKLPKNETDVMNIILDYYAIKKNEMIAHFKSLYENGARFSLTIDEWTSLEKRRYFNICVHYVDGQFYNLGLVYIPNKCTATETREIVETRLQEFDLSFEHHIVAITSGGPNVIKKFGCESPCEIVLCLNHAIHLSVLDTFFKNIKETTRDNMGRFEDSKLRTSFSSEDSECDDDETEDDADVKRSIDALYDSLQCISDNMYKVLKETRSLIKLFKKSPLKNITLQKYVKAEFGHELNLLLDVKTRWNSMLSMIERFLKLKNAIKKTLIELDMFSKWNENNISILDTLLKVLQPTKLSVEALSRKDATILTSEAILDILLKKLNSMDCDLAKTFLESLRVNINNRRNSHIVSLLNFLHSPDSFYQKNSDFFTSNCSKSSLINYTEELYNRLFPTPGSLDRIIKTESEINEFVEDNATISFELQLEKAIKGVGVNEKYIESPQQNLTKNIIKKEFQLYESTGKRTPNLEAIYKGLLTVKPTSTENERLSSISANIITEIRNKSSDEAINALVFLNAYFNNNFIIT